MESRVVEVNLTDSGGAFSLIYSIQKSLYSRNKRDIIFDYFSMGKFEKEAVITDIEKMGGRIFSANLRHNRLMGFVHLPYVFYKYCKSNSVKIVHIHSDSAYIMVMYAIPAKLAGVKNIIGHSHCAGMNGDYRKIKKFFHVLCRPLASKLISNYLSCSDLATKWMYVRKTRERAVFLKNGVNICQFEFDEKKRNIYRHELGLNNEVALCVVGDFGYQKNPLFACDVMRELDNNYKLFFIGDGPCKNTVKEYVTTNKLDSKVVFLGRRNVSEILNAMDIFLMPSRFEGLPVSGVEAQTNGLQCLFSANITRQIGILNSAIFLDIKEPCEWSEKIKRLNLNNNIRSEAAKVVQENGFDINETADYLYDLYRSYR